ncbi:hypothetical protein [Confluentibacter lentus]|uniref:hypothetical protein n=1 Tax=Confluentibacter lentus TaxID=1699412 RepID=UPI000C284EB7|nr:hypothetical protein [Confluentibacter lentus]
MKTYFLLIAIFLFFGCKKTLNVTEDISKDSDSNSIEIETVETQIQNQNDEEFIEYSTSTEISDRLNEIDITLKDGLEITTEKQLEAILAFMDFLANQEGKSYLDQLNNLVFLDIDNDGDEEVVFEYSVIAFPGTSTWGLNFLFGKIKNNKIIPIINESIGGKDWRKISFKNIDEKGLFWFETLSYSENDAMCCPSVKGIAKYEIINGKFNVIEN